MWRVEEGMDMFSASGCIMFSLCGEGADVVDGEVRGKRWPMVQSHRNLLGR